jgi:hypothetical protein
MVCQGLYLFNNFQVLLISAFIRKKNAKSCQEKELCANNYIQKNYQRLREHFCGKLCSFRDKCSLTKKAEVLGKKLADGLWTPAEQKESAENEESNVKDAKVI